MYCIDINNSYSSFCIFKSCEKKKEARNSVLYNYDSFWHVPISIKYINDYFICPVEPNIIESLDDSIWGFLRENVNDLV